MIQHRARQRRAFIASGDFAVEHRCLTSTLGHAMPAPDIGSASIAARTAHHRNAPGRGAAIFPTSQRWSFLNNSYWYVPPNNLPALLYNPSTGRTALVTDQTVLHITTYRHGYFWGKAVTQLGSSSPSTSSMVGSVTPEGQVLLTFTRTSSGSSPALTQGFGKMVRKFGQWTMENQMFTIPGSSLQIGHWAYMLQTRPGLPSWNSLPGVGESVPEFLNQ